MEADEIACGIVLYNPDEERLSQNLLAIEPQVKRIILIDNSTNHTLHPKWSADKKIEYIRNKCNKGIAYALNQIIQVADNEGYKWVVTLDQDSISPKNMISNYLELICLPKVAMIAPSVKDRNSAKNPKKSNDRYDDIDRCITSGALTNIDAVLNVGGFDSKLFIDFVDFELCARLIDANYRIIQDNKTVLLHQYGDIKEYSFIGHMIWTTNHGPKRRYYQMRNRLYCSKKYSYFFPLWRTIAFICSETAKIILFESKKIEKIVAIHKGIVDGLNM